MPKYVPMDDDDLYSMKPCFICGSDCLDENYAIEDVCSDLCRAHKQILEHDWNWFLWKDYEGEEDDW